MQSAELKGVETNASCKGVLIVGSFVGNGSLSRYVGGALAERLAEAGWRCTVTSRETGRLRRLVDMLGTAWKGRQYYSLAVVEVYSGPAFFWAEAVCWLLRRLGKPYVLALHGGNLPEFARTRVARVRKLLQSASVIVSPSTYLIEQLAWLGMDVQLLPNPVVIERYQFRLRRHLQPTLIWLRAFHVIYNPLLFPQVVARLATQMPNLVCTMVGPDKGDGSLEKTKACIRDLGLSGRLTVMPGIPHEEVPQWLGRADVFVNTTNFDNTPVSVIEAMASGLPVVSTNVGGVPYLLRHEETGLLVPPDHPEAMASAIQRLFAEPNLAERLSANGRRQVEQYDWSVVLPKWEALLNTLLQRPSRKVIPSAVAAERAGEPQKDQVCPRL